MEGRTELRFARNDSLHRGDMSFVAANDDYDDVNDSVLAAMDLSNLLSPSSNTANANLRNSASSDEEDCVVGTSPVIASSLPLRKVGSSQRSSQASTVLFDSSFCNGSPSRFVVAVPSTLQNGADGDFGFSQIKSPARTRKSDSALLQTNAQLKRPADTSPGSSGGIANFTDYVHGGTPTIDTKGCGRRRKKRSSLEDKIVGRLQTNGNSPNVLDDGFLLPEPTNDVMSMSYRSVYSEFFGLPLKAKHLFEKIRGIKEFFDWQKRCMAQYEQLAAGKNLIISLPTSGGKTLIAEICMLQEVLCSHRDAMLVLPFVSIVQEKIRSFEQFGLELNFLVEEYAANRGKIPPIKRRKKKSVYVATIEKAYGIVSSLIEAKRIHELGLVVIDELHMVGDGSSRGATLEQLLVLLMHSSPATRLIGMSATLSNLDELAIFLNADLFTDDFRPVKLTEFVKLGCSIGEVNFAAKCEEDVVKFSRSVLPTPMKNARDVDQLGPLCAEVVPDASCLVFCPTKSNAENVARLLADVLPQKLKEHKVPEKKLLYENLRQECDNKVCPTLKYCLPFGIAYHHSGLTADERKLIQDAYLEGVLCIICCTSTLAAGVNLPAKRVILRSITIGNQFLTRQQYKQMVGRAGRTGLDECGESIAIIQELQKAKIHELLSTDFEECRSSLALNGACGLKTLILTLIGLENAKSRSELLAVLHKTLIYVQRERTLSHDIEAFMDAILQSLLAHKLILPRKPKEKAQNDGAKNIIDNSAKHPETEESTAFSEFDEFVITPLGMACLRGNVDADFATQLYDDLKTAISVGIVLSSDLHLLFLIIPYNAMGEVKPDWHIFYNVYHQLSDDRKRVFEAVGISDAQMLKRKTVGARRSAIREDIYIRLYLAVLLLQLWEENSIWQTADFFQVSRGFIQNLRQSTLGFANAVTRFCMLEEFWALGALLTKFIERFAYCAQAELVQLMQIPGVKKGRALQLYNAGFKDFASIADADVNQLVSSVEHLSRKLATTYINAARMMIQEEKERILEEAEVILGGKMVQEIDHELNLMIIQS